MHQNGHGDLFPLHNARPGTLTTAQFDLTFDVSHGFRRDANEFNSDADAWQTIPHFRARLNLSASERERKSEVQNGALRENSCGSDKHTFAADIRRARSQLFRLALVVNRNGGDRVDA